MINIFLKSRSFAEYIYTLPESTGKYGASQDLTVNSNGKKLIGVKIYSFILLMEGLALTKEKASTPVKPPV